MKIYRNGSFGNAHFIMAKVCECLQGAGRSDEIKSVMERMRSSDYDNLCKVAAEVTFGSVEVVDTRKESDI